MLPKNYINGMLALTVSVGFLYIDLPSKQTAPVGDWLLPVSLLTLTIRCIFIMDAACFSPEIHLSDIFEVCNLMYNNFLFTIL